MAIDDLSPLNSSQHTFSAKTTAPIALQTTFQNSLEKLQNSKWSSTLCPNIWQNVWLTMAPSSNMTPHWDSLMMAQALWPPPKPLDSQCNNCANTPLPHNSPTHKIPYHPVTTTAIVDTPDHQLGGPLKPTPQFRDQPPRTLLPDQNLQQYEMIIMQEWTDTQQWEQMCAFCTLLTGQLSLSSSPSIKEKTSGQSVLW